MKTFLALTTGFLSGFIFACAAFAADERKKQDEIESQKMKEESETLHELLKGYE